MSDESGIWEGMESSPASKSPDKQQQPNASARLADSQSLPPQAARPVRRDRIVFLGRRGSGKTVYISRAYEKGYRRDVSDRKSLRMKAVVGSAHRRLMAVIDSLARGQWPAATTGNDPFVIDVTKGSRSVPLIVLDYPGEVFTRAIVDDMSGEAEQELRDHVDAASAVILLLDPGVAVHGTAQDLVEDEHGMPQVVERVRKWPGGQNVPVAMVLTKYDLHEPLIRAEGGKLAFVRRWYPRLIESVLDGGGTGKVFGVAAVRGIEDARGNVAPGIAKPAYNVLRPLEYCVATMFESDRMEKDKRNRERVARSRAERQEHDRREAARASSKSRLTVLAIVMTVILMALVAAVFVWG